MPGVQARRGFSLTPITSLSNAAPAAYAINSPNRLPVRSDQLPPSPASGARQLSPSRVSRHGAYRNASDNVAAILGGYGGPGRPPTRTRSESGAGLPRTPSSGFGGRAVPPSRESNGVVSAAAAEESSFAVGSSAPSFDCKVFTSSGRSSAQKVQLAVGVGSTQGLRPSMEDSHLVILDAPLPDGSTMSLFAIFDGHCGRRVADLGAHILPDLVLAHPSVGQNNAAALVEAVVETDKAIFRQMGRADGGSTLIAAALHNRMLFVANLGDARAVLYDGSNTIAMSIDHKPMDSEEQQRIVRCGGMVHFGRVNGCLAVSRALGDFEFKFNGNKYPNKEFMVSNVPDIKQINITDAAKFLILACDGLWDVLSNEDATTYVNHFLSSADLRDLNRALSVCAQQLVMHAVDQGSMDNVSAVIVCFHSGEVAGMSTATASTGVSNAVAAANAGARGLSMGSSPSSSFGGLSASSQRTGVGGFASSLGAASALPSLGAGTPTRRRF